MLKTVQTAHTPETVIVEQLPDGKSRVIMRKNVQTVTTEATETEPAQTSYTADEVTFILAQATTADDISASFDSWWEYGLNHDEELTEPTIEERVAALENFAAMSLIGGV